VDPLDKALKGLEARTLEELLTRLTELAALRAKGEPVRLPRVTLHLRSGRELQGFLLEQRDDGRSNKAVVLQALSTDGRRSEPDAIFIRPEMIEALTVHDLPSLYQPPRGGPPPPTKLELRRKLGERQASLASALGTPLEVQVDWERLPAESEALSALDTLASRAFGILDELCRDVMALESLRANVRQLHLSVGMASQVQREGQRLLLVTVMSPTGWLSREALHQAIEKVL
jgi:hypothetical protein